MGGNGSKGRDKRKKFQIVLEYSRMGGNEKMKNML